MTGLKVIMMKGLPASGKSTWAKNLCKTTPNWKRINKDDLRDMLDSGVWSKQNEKFVVKLRDLLVERALVNGYNVVVDDTNLHIKHELQLRAIAGIWGAEFEVKSFIDVPLDVCIARDELREGRHKVGKGVILNMYNQFFEQNDTKSTNQ